MSPLRGHWGGGGRWSQIQKSGEAVKRLHRLAPHLLHVADSSGNGQMLNVEHIGTMRHQEEHFDAGLSRGNVLGFKGVNISSKVGGMPRSQDKTNYNTFSKNNMH